MKYFIYARKSSEPEDRQMSSNEDQIAEMQRVATDMNKHVVDIFSEAKSAKRPGRLVFDQMLKRIERGEADGIICWKLNRLARNPVDGGQISWLLQQAIIKHIQTYERSYTPEDNVLMMQVEFGMANQYIKDLKIDVARGMKRKIERGWYPTKPPPGYSAVNREIRNLNDAEVIPHPVQFYIIRKLWDLILTDRYSVADIKREADRLNLQKKDGTHYSVNTFRNLFDNPFYTGCFYWTPFNGIKTRYEGKHLPMITSDEFLRAQRILHNRGDIRQRVNSFPYRGIIKCGECNGNVSAEQKLQAICTSCKLKFSIITKQICPRCKTHLSEMKNPKILNKVYYRCTKTKNPFCTQQYVLLNIIEDRLISELNSISIQMDFHDWAIEIIMQLNCDTRKKNDVSLLKKRKTELEERLNGLIRMRADRELDKDHFDKLKNEVSKELLHFENKLQLESNINNRYQVLGRQYIDFALHSLSLYKKEDPTIKTNILNKLGSNLTLFEKKLEISTHKVFKHLKECEVLYYAEIHSFEPKNNHRKQRQISKYFIASAVLLTKLKAIRTCLLGILRMEDEAEEKKRTRYLSSTNSAFM